MLKKLKGNIVNRGNGTVSQCGVASQWSNCSCKQNLLLQEAMYLVACGGEEGKNSPFTNFFPGFGTSQVPGLGTGASFPTGSLFFSLR